MREKCAHKKMIAHYVNWLEIIVCLLLYHVDCRPSIKFIKNSASSQHTDYRNGNGISNLKKKKIHVMNIQIKLNSFLLKHRYGKFYASKRISSTK